MKLRSFSTILELFLILCTILTFILTLVVIDLSNENKRIKQVADDNKEIAEELGNDLYRCEMERDEWKELFYSQIDMNQ